MQIQWSLVHGEQFKICTFKVHLSCYYDTFIFSSVENTSLLLNTAHILHVVSPMSIEYNNNDHIVTEFSQRYGVLTKTYNETYSNYITGCIKVSLSNQLHNNTAKAN